jgi:hypothetical protein
LPLQKIEGSSYINHFLQPDTLVPDPSNPQSLNRYSYVENRPVNFNDPTGHQKEKELTGFQRERQRRLQQEAGDRLKDILKKRYHWNLTGKWAYDAILTAFQTANDIEGYVDGITGGLGRDWMRKYMGNLINLQKG